MGFTTIDCTIERYDEETDECAEIVVEATFEHWGDEPEVGQRAGFCFDYAELPGGGDVELSESDVVDLERQFKEWLKWAGVDE